MKILNLFQHDGTRHSISVSAELLPEIEKALQHLMYKKGKYNPRGVLKIYSEKGKLLFSMPAKELALFYSVR